MKIFTHMAYDKPHHRFTSPPIVETFHSHTPGLNPGLRGVKPIEIG